MAVQKGLVRLRFACTEICSYMFWPESCPIYKIQNTENVAMSQNVEIHYSSNVMDDTKLIFF